MFMNLTKRQTGNIFTGLALAGSVASLYGKNDTICSIEWIENYFSIASSTDGASELSLADHLEKFLSASQVLLDWAPSWVPAGTQGARGASGNPLFQLWRTACVCEGPWVG